MTNQSLSQHAIGLSLCVFMSFTNFSVMLIAWMGEALSFRDVNKS